MESLYLPDRDHGDALPYLASGGPWQRQVHVDVLPFHSVDDALALACALQLWRRARRLTRPTPPAPARPRPLASGPLLRARSRAITLMSDGTTRRSTRGGRDSDTEEGRTSRVGERRSRGRSAATEVTDTTGGAALNAMEASALRGQVASLQLQLSEAQADLARQQEDRAQEADLLGKLLARVADLEARSRAAAERAAAEAHEDDGLQARVSELEARLRSVATDLESSRAARAQVLADLEATQEKLLDEQLARQDAQKAVERERAEGERLRAQVAELEAQLAAEHAGALAQLREEHEQVLARAREEHARELEGARVAHAGELETARNEHARELEAARVEHARLLDEARAEHAREREAAGAAHARALEALRAELEQARAETAEVSRALAAARRLLDDATKVKQSLERAARGFEPPAPEGDEGPELEIAATAEDDALAVEEFDPEAEPALLLDED